MEVVYCSAKAKPDKFEKQFTKAFIDNGWLLVRTDPPIIDNGCGRHVLGWPEDKGKAIKPKGYEKVIIVTI